MLSETACPDKSGKSRLSAVKASFAGKTLITFLVFIFLLTTAQAQDIDATLAGNTEMEGFSIKNISGTTLFRVNGLGKVGIGTTNPASRLHVHANGATKIDLSTSSTTEPIFQRFFHSTNIQGGAVGFDTDDNVLKLVHGGNFNTSTNGLAIASGGNVGIGTTTPLTPLHITPNSTSYALRIDQGTSGDGILTYVNTTSSTQTLFAATSNVVGLYVKGNGEVGIGTTSPNFKLDVRGTIGNNTTMYHSDIRWKKNVQSLTNSLEKVTRLRGVSYEWRRDEFAEMNFLEGQRIGLIAQEVEEVIPELVSTAADGYKSVEYANLVAVLIEAVKEQQKQIEALESRINSIALKELDKESYGYIKTNINK